MWTDLKRVIRSLLGSKKFITAATGIGVAAGARYGLHVSPDAVAAGLGVVAVLVHAQGQADKGKEAAKVAADQERWRASDEALAAKLRTVRTAQPPQP